MGFSIYQGASLVNYKLRYWTSFGCPFCMGCPAEEGGGNFLIDGYEILRQLQEDPETRRPVNDVNVEQGIKCR